ncbi:MAG: tetratricopeptide repeat protein [Alphaproteobacteria bacterium]
MRKFMPVLLCLAFLAQPQPGFAQEKIDITNLTIKAKQGDLWTQNYLGYLYLTGVPGRIRPDPKLAMVWIGSAAQRGYAEAQTNLALMYANGQGVRTNHELAAKWFLLSAKQNNKTAQYNLGTYYQTGTGVEKNTKEAAKWYGYAAKQNDRNAQLALAELYMKGDGVEKNDVEAVKWLKFAAKQSHPRAQLLLADMYKQNRAGQDYKPEELIALYKSAALAGDAEAAARYGIILEKGDEVEKNEKEAVFWLRKAADMAHPEAQYHLGKMYLEGRGVEKKDLAVAWVWFSLAANYDGEKQLYSDARDSTSQLLKPAELEQAQALAREWKPKERPKPK